ncbi:hypothetical protein [Thermincola ferriacetica]
MSNYSDQLPVVAGRKDTTEVVIQSLLRRATGYWLLKLLTPADILTEKTVQAALDRGLAGIPKATLRDVLDILVEIPEYQNSPVKPVIRVGSEKDYAGKVFVVMAGGTNGGEKVARAYFEAGVGTLVAMHMPDDVIRAVREQNIGNIVVAGHMPSDSIGINKIIAALEAKGVEVIRMSGVVAP